MGVDSPRTAEYNRLGITDKKAVSRAIQARFSGPLPCIGLLSRGSPVKNAISFQTHRLTGLAPFCQETAKHRLAVALVWASPPMRGYSAPLPHEVRRQVLQVREKIWKTLKFGSGEAEKVSVDVDIGSETPFYWVRKVLRKDREREMMMKQTRGRAPTVWSSLRVLARLASLFVCLIALHGTAAAGPDVEAYQWHGELVSLDHGEMTVRSRVVSREGLADLHQLRRGEAIVINWSGFEDRANGIRFVMPEYPDSDDRFHLTAEFVEADLATSYLTFKVRASDDSLEALSTVEPGTWTTVTSPHQTMGKERSVLAIDMFDTSRRTPGPAASAIQGHDAFRWHGELVSIEDGAVILKSRIVSRERLQDLKGLRNGDAIAISWSGFGNRANGIRFVKRARPGLHEGFRLPAEFVSADVRSQYVTFKVRAPQQSLASVYSLEPGAWATVTSPHSPTAETDPVLTVNAFDVTKRGQRAASTVRGYESYRWHGQLVSFDDSSITVKSRIVSREGLADLDSFTPGEQILVNWSGFEDRANGIRFVKRTRPLWDEGFRLPAEFVSADTATRYVTFKVSTPDGSLAAVGSLEPGAWVTVTSRHRPAGDAEAVVRVDAFDTTRQARRYAWQGDLLSFDASAAAVEVSAPIEDHVARYVDRFREGDEVVLIWAPGQDEDVAAIRYSSLAKDRSWITAMFYQLNSPPPTRRTAVSRLAFGCLRVP